MHVQDRRAALEKQVVGTQAYLDMLLLLSEQLAYPEDLEKKISTWIAQHDKDRNSPRIKQYDFRKQLNTFNPATGFAGEAGEVRSARPSCRRLARARAHTTTQPPTLVPQPPSPSRYRRC